MASTTGGALIVDSDRTFPRESPVCAYWLTRCEGFTVRSGSRVLGVVESIAGNGPLGLAETLQVRSRHRRRLLDAADVTAVVPARRLLISVREPAAPRLRPAAARLRTGAARTLARALVLLATMLARLVAFLRPRVAAWARAFGVTAGRMTLVLARAIRRELLPRAARLAATAIRAAARAGLGLRAALAELAEEAERLTVLGGQAQPDQPIERASRRQRRRNTLLKR